VRAHGFDTVLMVLGMDLGDGVGRTLTRCPVHRADRDGMHRAEDATRRDGHGQTSITAEDGMIVLTAKYFAKPGKGDEVEGLLRRMAPLVSANEPGCRLYHANRSADNADIFLLYEHYADQAALDAHRNTPHFKEIIEGAIVPLLEKRERELYQSVIA
jgi:quinol monooxygenase YgiN